MDSSEEKMTGVSKEALIMWISTTMFYFYAFIARSSFVTVLSHDFMKFYQVDATGLGTLTSCYYWVYTFMQIPSGIMIDRFKVKTIGAVMAGSTALGLLLLVATSNCYIAGFAEMLIGFGSSFAFLLVLKMVTAWYPKQKVAIMTSYTMGLGVTGPFIGSPIVATLTNHFDWRFVIAIYAGLGLLAAVALFTLLKLPEEKKTSSEENKNANDANAIQTESLSSMLSKVLSSKNLWILGLLTMMFYSPLSSLGDLWGVPFVQAVFHTNRTEAAVIANMIYVGFAVGSPFMAHLANYIGSYKKTMAVAIFGMTLGLVALVISGDLPTVFGYILFFTIGFFSSAQLTYALGFFEMPHYMGGTVSSFINMMSMLSGVILMPLVGYFINSSWNGLIENGVKVYSASDFRYGIIPVLTFSIAGVLLSLLVKDRSPNDHTTADQVN